MDRDSVAIEPTALAFPTHLIALEWSDASTLCAAIHLTGTGAVTNAQEKNLNRLAQSKGYRLEKVGKGPHHGRFSLVSIAEGSRVASGIPDAGFTFSLEEAEAWLKKK